MSTRAKKVFLFIGILSALVSACLGLETAHSNHLGWALLFAGTGFIATGCISLGILFVQAGDSQKNADRSLWLPCFSALAISLITPLEYLYLPSVLPRGECAQDIGLILCAGALAFYLLSRQSKSLRQRFNHMHNRKHLSLFSIILCPISASLLLFGLGLGIGFSSWSGLLVSLILLFPGLLYHMRMTNRWSHL
jgi:hypothetical protein